MKQLMLAIVLEAGRLARKECYEAIEAWEELRGFDPIRLGTDPESYILCMQPAGVLLTDEIVIEHILSRTPLLVSQWELTGVAARNMHRTLV